MTPHEIVQEKVIALETALLSAHPGMRTLLKDIHDTLKSQPEIVTLLSESEVATLVKGLERVTNVEIVTGKVGTKTSKSTRLSKLGVDDL